MDEYKITGEDETMATGYLYGREDGGDKTVTQAFRYEFITRWGFTECKWTALAAVYNEMMNEAQR